MSRALLVVWLGPVWVLLWGSPTPANLLSGLLVAVVLVAVFPPRSGPSVAGLHPIAVLRYGLHFARELVDRDGVGRRAPCCDRGWVSSRASWPCRCAPARRW